MRPPLASAPGIRKSAGCRVRLPLPSVLFFPYCDRERELESLKSSVSGGVGSGFPRDGRRPPWTLDLLPFSGRSPRRTGERERWTGAGKSGGGGSEGWKWRGPCVCMGGGDTGKRRAQAARGARVFSRSPVRSGSGKGRQGFPGQKSLFLPLIFIESRFCLPISGETAFQT